MAIATMTTPLPISFFPFLLLIPAICFTIFHANSNLLCIQSEREALLKFKNYLCNHLKSESLQWVPGLSSLQSIDLSYANLSKATDWLQVAFKHPSLLELNLSACILEDDPSSISFNSSKLLVVLNLSWNHFSSVPKSIFSLHSLVSIVLSGNYLEGPIPDYFGNISFLEVLDLHQNSLNSSIPNSLYSLSHLRFLHLSRNILTGNILYNIGNMDEIPRSFSNLNFLNHFNVSYNNLTRQIPTSTQLQSFENLSYMGNHLCGPPLTKNCTSKIIPTDIANNGSSNEGSKVNWLYVSIVLGFVMGFSGVVAPLFFIRPWRIAYYRKLDHICGRLYELSSLEEFVASENQLNGQIPLSIGQLSSLEEFDVSENQLNGQIPLSIGELSSLKLFVVSNNQLNGQISLSIGQLSSLEKFVASENQLNGQIPLSIGQLSSLEEFDLNGQIPLSIGQLSSLEVFDVSENQLTGTFPLSFGRLESLETLDCGYNLLEGVVSETHFSNLTRLTTLAASWPKVSLVAKIPKEIVLFGNLQCRNFRCPLPRVFPTLVFLILSNNSFSGSLFELLCNSSSRKRMEVLYIDKNLISGDIPDCWNHWQGLNLLNLGSNNLTVKIPHSLWHLNLTILNLRNNTMFGEFPSTMQNFLDLIMIDLSENHFSRSVPAWIGDKLSNLVILSLRSNNFDGHIPHKICDLQFLQNLDLAHNNISGVIPKCFNNLSAMATTIKINNFVLAKYVDAGLVFLNALLVLKGREDEYWSSLGLVTSMDISANSLTGEIPKEIGSLVGLLSLNFSGNLLTGNIPDNIGNMELMESLDDLSMNQLNGEIPPSFSNLNFLNHFNNCTSKGIPIDVANNGSSREGSKVNWLYVSIVLGFVMGFWGVVAPLFFIRSWRLAYYRKLDHVGRKLYVSWATMDM
ncbi:hypothetical protein ES332_1Z017800v1 [Gossypium tomentosum]|uniref:Leucine-rich repeat-containing N-terminal plant-type domain-containing protein n=1 Tax=Gossypium tomentosum TaxID=34277 RepID=A0A5C7J0M2_GOSTO|nr:hypothetical protein ES332_1Z017800v1 [Gossypium tomentosum]